MLCLWTERAFGRSISRLGSAVLCDGFPYYSLYCLQWNSVRFRCEGVSYSREFDHYVKHVSLGKWTKEEVDKVLMGGNKVGFHVCALMRRKPPRST